jgi:adenylate kinase family enzyme
MQRIAIIGCGGSGKTTLANTLAARLAIPVIHIDSHYWQVRDGRRVESTPEQWAARHRELVGQPQWVMDGMKLGVLPERLARADAIVYLDLSTRACLAGVVRRRIRYRGQLRPDLGVYDQISWEFLRWVWSFRHRQRPALLEALARFEGQTFMLHHRTEVRRFLAMIDAPNRPASVS